MDNNEHSQLLRLKSPYFPTLGDVFVVVSAGDPFLGGIPHFFGEFFIFSTKGLDAPIAQRVYLHQHLARGGAAEIFELAKVRAIAALQEELVRHFKSDDRVRFDEGLSTVETDWYQVAMLYRAGILNREKLRDIENKTRSSFVVHAVREVLDLATVTFEEAKDRQ